MADCILAIDIGTTSLKAALVSECGAVEAYSRQPVAARTDFLYGAAWLDALRAALDELRAADAGAAIEAICVGGNGPTVCSVDGTALLWNAPVPAPISVAAAKTAPSLYIPRLLAFRALFPAQWAATPAVLGAPEFVAYALTGRAHTFLPEPRFAPAYWGADALECAGFSRADVAKLPPFVAPGSLAGQVTAAGARLTGLLEGTLVFCGAPDFVTALIGTATVFPGTLCDRAGSSEGLNLCTANPVRGKGIRTLPSAIPGLWNAGALIPESGALKAGDPAALLERFCAAVGTLRAAAQAAGEPFPAFMAMAGGQCKDAAWVQRKADSCGLAIRVPVCADAELVGCAALARVGLGDFDSVVEAAAALALPGKTYVPGEGQR